MPSAYDLRYGQLRNDGSVIITESNDLDSKEAETVVAGCGPPLFQKHPYVEEQTLERKQSFRSENTDEDIRTIKALIIGNFKLFKTLTESINQVSVIQNQMADLLKECVSIVHETNRLLREKSVESTPSNPTTPRNIVGRPILSSRLPVAVNPIKKKIPISK